MSNKEQRRNTALRRLIIAGNCLSLWAGRAAESSADHEELNDLFNAWEKAVEEIRQTADTKRPSL